MAGLFYVFHGDDSHSQRETLAEIESRLGDATMVDLNTNHLRGRDLAISELLHACNSVPFLAEKRLVIIEDLLLSEPPFLEGLQEYLPNLPDTTRLVLLESKEISKSHPIVLLATNEETGYVKSFIRPVGLTLERWIRRKVSDGDGSISSRAVHLLAINVGNDLDLLDQEIEKLLLYKNGESIEPEDVTLLCPYVAEASIFDLVDAMGNRNGKIAAQILRKKLDEGTDPSFLFAMVVRQFRLLIQTKELAQLGCQQSEIANRLNIHGFVAGKVMQQSHNFDSAQLEEIYAHLLEIDVGAKTGRTELITELSLLVAGVAG
jgi:DNA polymerase-3 subunit delta